MAKHVAVGSIVEDQDSVQVETRCQSEKTLTPGITRISAVQTSKADYR